MFTEFVDNSQTIVGAILKEAEDASAAVGKLMQQMGFVAARQLRRFSTADPRGKTVLRKVELEVRTLQGVLVSAGHHGSDPEQALTAHALAATDRIRNFMSGRVGPEPTAAKRAAWIADSQWRVREEKAPSWGDRKKKELLRHNDCLIWHEMLDFAGAQVPRRAVVFVTRDLKDGSWVAHRNGQAAGAHPDLVDEMRAQTSTQLIVMTTADLVAYVKHSESKQVWKADTGWGEEASTSSIRPVPSFFPD
ncbi:hypothetical protein CF165_42560 [Amycolatopsis vastitatis]|uniref:PIN like domain-containing protein n=1 Tax=Amycolatopsis vastitatis TaxID=1905142 RepID=A0A229SNQ1_9PSEU|nr:hypothetical protein CF165_42560 [Amycolatopsis vastitatis]